MRGSGSGPAGIFWSLDSLIRATFDINLGAVPFAFDTLSAQSSILSSQTPIEYDGVFYWVGVDRFLSFNGVVREVPNNYNINWFFDNLNKSQAQKVFSFKVPRFGEIWWCFPYGDATECTHAVIQNVREGVWYDTILPNGGRSAGAFAQVYTRPFMTGILAGPFGQSLWQHETGVNEVAGIQVEPIVSFFKTTEISMIASEDAVDQALRIGRLEPDFVQAGPLTVRVEGRDNARSANKVGETFTFPAVPTTPAEETVPLKEIRRLMSFRFESNALDGDYQMGQTLGHIEPADGRITS